MTTSTPHVTPMTPEAAWRLVNALTSAAREHEAEALHGSHKGYSNAIQNENRAERALVAALTGLPIGRVPYPEADQPTDEQIDEAAAYAAMVNFRDELRSPIPMDSTVVPRGARLTDGDLRRIVETIGKDAMRHFGEAS